MLITSYTQNMIKETKRVAEAISAQKTIRFVVKLSVLGAGDTTGDFIIGDAHISYNLALISATERFFVFLALRFFLVGL